jgi:hypothetical protein
MEEAKAQEIAKLQGALQEMHAQTLTANAQLMKARKSSEFAVGQAAKAAKEMPSDVEISDAKVEKLTEEKEKLKVLNSHDPQCVFYCDRDSMLLRPRSP